MILLLCIVSLLLWAYVIGKAEPGVGLVRLSVFALCGFFCLYTVVGAGFFWADCFRFGACLAVCIALEAAAAVWLTVRDLRRGGTAPDGEDGAAQSVWHIVMPRVTWDGGRYWIPIAVALLALPFTWNKFELYSMGQDQGTYQVKALALMAYDTHNYMEMKEFTKLETAKERQKYLDFIYGQNNLYLPRVEAETDTDASHFETITGTIHGLPTYSSLLALWGLLFGYANMIGVQTVLYLCLLFLVFFTAENMELSRPMTGVVTALTAFSPIALWCSKSSLTEIGLSVLFALFLYGITGERRRRWLAGAALVVFGFFHISIYVFMPVFVSLLFYGYVREGGKGWLVSAVATMAGFLVSAFWSFDIAPYYSYGNYSVLWKLTRNILHEGNIVPVIIVVCSLLSILACWLMSRRGSRLAGLVRDKAARSRYCEAAAAWAIRLVLAGSAVFFVYKGIVKAEYIRYCQYLQISTYLYMTGLLLIPFLYGFLLWKPQTVLRDRKLSLLTLLFFYCVIAYSMFMRLDVLFYYYYARYVTIFLPVVFLLAGKLLDGTGRKKAADLCVCCLALASFLPYDLGLLTQKDHTRCEWEVLGDVCEDITAEDAFIVGPDEQQIVFIFPVKLLTGCDVYYADEDLRGQIGGLAGRYRNVYYLDYDGALETKMEADGRWQDGLLSVKKVYTNWNHLSYLDYFNITNPLTPIPLNYVEYRLKLSLHEICLEE